MRKEYVDVVGDKPVKNDAGEMSVSEEAKPNIMKSFSISSFIGTPITCPTNRLLTIDVMLKKAGKSCGSIRHNGGDIQGIR